MSDVVRARIDPALKAEVSAVLSEMGLSLSDAIRLLFVRVAAEKALPFEIRVPNAETQAAMRDARAGKVARFAGVEELLADLNSGDEAERPSKARVARVKRDARARSARPNRRSATG